MCDQEAVLRRGRRAGVFTVLNALLSTHTEDFGKEEVVATLLAAIDSSGLKENVLKEYGSQHFFQNIY